MYAHNISDPLALNLKHVFLMVSPTIQSGLKVEQCWSTSFWHSNKPIVPGDDFVKCKSGLQKVAYAEFMSSHYNLDFIKHMTERIDSLFQPQKLNCNCIQFKHSIAALKPFNSGNVMKVIKTLFNAWTTSSRMGGAHYVYPCLFGCNDSCDRLGHYSNSPNDVFTL